MGREGRLLRGGSLTFCRAEEVPDRRKGMSKAAEVLRDDRLRRVAWASVRMEACFMSSLRNTMYSAPTPEPGAVLDSPCVLSPFVHA